MVVSSSSLSLIPGTPSNLTVTLVPLNGFNLPISLSCSGLPQGTTCKFSPASVTPNGAPVNEHGDSHAPDSTGALTQAGSAWCAGRNDWPSVG